MDSITLILLLISLIGMAAYLVTGSLRLGIIILSLPVSYRIFEEITSYKTADDVIDGIVHIAGYGALFLMAACVICWLVKDILIALDKYNKDNQ